MMTSSGGDAASRRCRPCSAPARRRGRGRRCGGRGAAAAPRRPVRPRPLRRRRRPPARRPAAERRRRPTPSASSAAASAGDARSFFMVLFFVVALRARPCRSRRCGCGRPARGRRRRSCRRRSCRCARRLSIASIDAVDDRVVDRGLDLDLGQEVDDVLGAAVQLGVALLPAEALDFGHRDALHADRGQGLAHFVELERLDDRGHHLHCGSLPGVVIRTSSTPTARRCRC